MCRSTPTLALVALLAAAALGCVRPLRVPETAASLPVPEGWRQAGDSIRPGAGGADPASLAAWWRQLDDPVLDRLVERTLAGSLDLAAARTRVAEARGRRGVVRAALGPTVDLAGSAAATERSGDGSSTSESFGLALDTAWEVDLFGGNRLAVAASQAELEATVEDLRAVQVALLAEVVTTYVELRTVEARRAVVEASLASREETLELTSWRAQAGLASALEVAQATSSVEQARAGLPSLVQSATAARLRLELLAGEIPGRFDWITPLTPNPSPSLAGGEGREGNWIAPLPPNPSPGASEVEDPAAEIVPVPPARIAAGIPADTLRQRPDVRAAERLLAAALARRGEADAARYPSLRLAGSIETGAASLADLLDADALVANLFAGLTAPIFQAGRIRQNVAIQDAAAERAAIAYRDAVLAAYSEVETALSAYRHTQERIAALERATDAAREADTLARQRYAAGLVDLLVVLDSERTLLGLEEQRTSARGELTATFATLYRALGGGWTAAPTGA